MKVTFDLSQWIQHEVNQQTIPGAVVGIYKKNQLLYREAFGYAAVYPTKEKMTVDTVFDVASLTKVVCTTPLILQLIGNGKIHLHDRVSFFLPAFNRDDKKDITIYQLLTHTSGMRAHYPFYEMADKDVLNTIAELPLHNATGKQVEYSDLGFITLYYLIEAITETPFAEHAQTHLFERLEMNQTGFFPQAETCAATEYDPISKRWLKGIVHDENARHLGGISGHAGLFSTVKDLGNFMSMITNDGVYKGKQILATPVVELARSCFTENMGERRGLGWLLKSSGPSTCGDLFSQSSYGHTGFTGTSIWVDPLKDLHVIALTNRVHFGRENQILRFRSRLHNRISTQFT